MKRYVNTPERDGGKAALQVEWLRLRQCLLDALAYDLHKMGFDLPEGHGLHQGLNIDILGFEIVGYIGKGIEGSKLVFELAQLVI